MKLSPGAVLVTGASTGIGKAIVTDLAERGVDVIAAVRDLSTVDDHPHITPLRLDVTSSEEIAAAAETVAASLGPDGLHGLVNNAGIAVGGPVEFTDVDQWRQQFEVNVFGQVAVTQAFLPLVRAGRGGRVLFTGSVAGRVPNPLMAPYVGSKHAIRGIAGSLRQELHDQPIEVSLIAPGSIDTPIWDKADDQIAEIEVPEEAQRLYGHFIDQMPAMVEYQKKHATAPSKVADAVRHALYAKRPRAEYLVGLDARALASLKAGLPDRAFDVVVDQFFKRV